MGIVEVFLMATSLICIAICSVLLAVSIRIGKGLNVHIKVEHVEPHAASTDRPGPLTSAQMQSLQDTVNTLISDFQKKNDANAVMSENQLSEINSFMTGGYSNGQDR